MATMTNQIELTNQFVVPVNKTNGSVFFRMIYP